MTDAHETRRRRSPAVLIGIGIALVLFLGLYFLALKSFRDSGERKAAPFILGNHDLTDGVAIDATVLAVDPVKGEMTVRMAFEPHGAVAADDGGPSVDLTLLVSAGAGNVERSFSKRKLMAPTDVTLELFDGQVTSYPFDHYKAQLFVAMVAKPPTTSSSTGSSGTDAAGGATSGASSSSSGSTASSAPETQVPISLRVFESVHGFSLDVASAPDANRDNSAVDAVVKVDRASSTLIFAIFVMVLMWALALGAIVLALTVLIGKRKVELAMFGFLGSLLFAFPAVRNAVPGTPPIGSYNDYIAFFWAEAIVAVALIIILTVWIFRRTT